MDGFAADHRGQPAALSAAGIHLPLLDLEIAEQELQPPPQQPQQRLGAEERSLVAAAAAAEVAADPAVRGALLEGLCLFVSGALLAQPPGQPVPADGSSEEAQLEAVLPLLRGKVQQRAEAAAAAAAALLQTRVALPALGEEDDDEDMDGLAAAGDGGARGEQRGVLVPVALLTSGDEPDGAGLLPTALPAELLQFPSCRQLQLQLLALQDAQLSRSQLQLLATGGLLRLLLLGQGSSTVEQQQATPATLPGTLRRLVAAMSGSGASSVADTASYQLLLWLLEAEQQQPGASAGEWQQLLRRSLVHETWWRWQQGLWSGAAAALPATHAGAVAATVQQQWAAAAAGPLRMHIGAGTVLASAVTVGPATLIADRSARLLQLKFAARQLRTAAAAGEGSSTQQPSAAAAAEWAAAAATAAATIAAHLPSVPAQHQRLQVEAALGWLAGERCTAPAAAQAQQQAQQDAQLLALVGDALASSSHPVLRDLLQPVLLPALEGLLNGIIAAPTMSTQGEREVEATAGLLSMHRPSLAAGCFPCPNFDRRAPTECLWLACLPACRGPAGTRPRVGSAGPPAPAPAAAPCGRRPGSQVRLGAAAHAEPAAVPGGA